MFICCCLPPDLPQPPLRQGLWHLPVVRPSWHQTFSEHRGTWNEEREVVVCKHRWGCFNPLRWHTNSSQDSECKTHAALHMYARILPSSKRKCRKYQRGATVKEGQRHTLISELHGNNRMRALVQRPVRACAAIFMCWRQQFLAVRKSSFAALILQTGVSTLLYWLYYLIYEHSSLLCKQFYSLLHFVIKAISLQQLMNRKSCPFTEALVKEGVIYIYLHFVEFICMCVNT